MTDTAAVIAVAVAVALIGTARRHARRLREFDLLLEGHLIDHDHQYHQGD